MSSIPKSTLTSSSIEFKNKKRRKTSQSKAQKHFVFFSLTPIMIVFLIFSAIPIVWGLVLSFYQYNPLQEHSPFVGLKNYLDLLKDDVFIKSFWNTFKFVIIAVPANIVLTLMIAIGINRIRSKLFRNLFRTVFFLPCIAPLAGSAVVWSTMFNKDTGLFNVLLNALHIPGVDWLTDPSIAMYSVIAMTLWADMGFNIVLFMAGLDSIPKMFYEAAELDGANRWKTFWNITVPLLSRTSLFVTIMTCLSYFQMFPQFQILTNGEPQNETRVLALSIYDHAFTYMNMGYASAIASVLFVIILIITILQLKLGKSQWEY
ncbi:sugar ABC transporter permease [Bacillus sp. FJAT-49736]|uniref:carbohydrate ABC transporter permease n=1 Tax=Bacillus sp. FJAT-49736 TaxID=2833582 RepID=UPI001BC98F61|nr:sugar ABC transporter permease [Bacillus sp. FJAT-49736]MBS4172864.1 sugar ABC transporter permease [Bacillus sp. FJAT-49736]